jgi:hypothetical protein
MSRQIAHLRSLSVPFVLYFALAILMTWPLALYVTRAVPGNAFDSWQNLWNLWWLRRALIHGDNPYVTPMLYYPQGASLLLHTLNPINFLITLPVIVTQMLGDPFCRLLPINFSLPCLSLLPNLAATYNAAILVSLTLCGLCTYFLALDVTGSRPAALVGGVVFACSGYLLSQVAGGHTHMVAAWPLPLAMLALRRTVRSPSLRNTLLAGFALGLNLLADWQYFLFILIWTGWYVCWIIAVPEHLGHLYARAQFPARLKAIAPLLGALVVALALASPLIVATARASLETPTAATEGGPNFRLDHSVDLADLVIPSQLHPIWGTFAEQAQSYKVELQIQSKTAYLGVIALTLAGLGVRAGRERAFWAASVVMFILLAMGPRLQIAGWKSGIPLPAAILFELPFIGIFRYPVRFIAVAMVALAVLAALGMQAVLMMRQASRNEPSLHGSRQFTDLKTRLIVAGSIALLALDNLTLPFPLVGIYIPPYYWEIAREPGTFAVMEAPLYSATSPFYLLYQTIHEKPLVGGYTSRRLPYAMLDELPVLRVLAYAKPAPDIIEQEMEIIAPGVFHYFNIRYLMLHSAGGALRYGRMTQIAAAVAGDQPPLRDVAFVRTSDNSTASGLRRSFWLGNQESYGSVLVYRTSTPTTTVPFIGVGSGWNEPRLADGRSVREVLDQATWADELGWLEREAVSRTFSQAAHLTVYSSEPCRIRLLLRLEAEGAGRLLLQDLAGDQRAEWALEAGMQTVSVELHLRPGKTTLQLVSQESKPLRVWGVNLDLLEATTP